LASETADAVLAAQAYHWFQTEAALQEFHRILKPAGWVVLMWNERDETDPFTAEYGAAWGAFAEAVKIETARARSGYSLFDSPLFTAHERVTFKHCHEMTEEGMLGRASSTSYAPREQPALAALTSSLRQAFARHQRQGKVVMCYETAVFLAQRP
jgi:SAM-dependent methyltransferase